MCMQARRRAALLWRPFHFATCGPAALDSAGAAGAAHGATLQDVQAHLGATAWHYGGGPFVCRLPRSMPRDTGRGQQHNIARHFKTKHSGVELSMKSRMFEAWSNRAYAGLQRLRELPGVAVFGQCLPFVCCFMQAQVSNKARVAAVLRVHFFGLGTAVRAEEISTTTVGAFWGLRGGGSSVWLHRATLSRAPAHLVA